MIKTSDLIEALVADARPVRRLRPLAHRAALWLCLPALIFGLLTLPHSLRPELAQRLQKPEFVISLVASLLTGVTSAAAAFMLNVPGRSGYWMLLPLPSLGVWLATIGQSCLMNWIDIGPEGTQAGATARYVGTAILTSLPLSIAMIAMLRRGAAFRPHALTLTGSLAVAAMSAAAVLLFQRMNASAMVLM